MSAYSKTPLVEKLGIEEDMTVSLVRAPKNYKELLGETPSGVIFQDKVTPGVELIHAFIKTKNGLQTLSHWKKSIDIDGAIWISWPKQTSGVKTDLNENIIRDAALRMGLVDVKVCALDETWSCLKLVHRSRNR